MKILQETLNFHNQRSHIKSGQIFRIFEEIEQVRYFIVTDRYNIRGLFTKKGYKGWKQDNKQCKAVGTPTSLEMVSREPGVPSKWPFANNSLNNDPIILSKELEGIETSKNIKITIQGYDSVHFQVV